MIGKYLYFYKHLMQRNSEGDVFNEGIYLRAL
jgi:hypothetical protein